MYVSRIADVYCEVWVVAIVCFSKSEENPDEISLSFLVSRWTLARPRAFSPAPACLRAELAPQRFFLGAFVVVLDVFLALTVSLSTVVASAAVEEWPGGELPGGARLRVF